MGAGELPQYSGPGAISIRKGIRRPDIGWKNRLPSDQEQASPECFDSAGPFYLCLFAISFKRLPAKGWKANWASDLMLGQHMASLGA